MIGPRSSATACRHLAALAAAPGLALALAACGNGGGASVDAGDPIDAAATDAARIDARLPIDAAIDAPVDAPPLPPSLVPLTVLQGPLAFNNHYYYRLSTASWTDGEASATRMLGGHLVTIDDADENDFVQAAFADAPGSGRVWLGLSDAAAENSFAWVDGSPVAYTKWDPGEPNNAGEEDYVAMYSGNGRWVDVRDLANPGIGDVYPVVECVTMAPVYVEQGPVAYNGHTYYRLNSTTWTVAEAFAADVLGGHLVTIDDAAENDFVQTTFIGLSGPSRAWIGLSDTAVEGTFVWASGTPLTYTKWEPGEPNNSGDEDHVAMYANNGRWVDVANLANPPGIGSVYGVVEVP
jgi:hypothetical protein